MFLKNSLWILFVGSWSRSGMELPDPETGMKKKSGSGMAKKPDPDGEKSGSGMEKVQIRDKNL
jgi:hypothetical protein